MKTLILILWTLMSTTLFCQVPDAVVFTLQDVCDEIGGGINDLESCISNADPAGYDVLYNDAGYAVANSLARFRNYTHPVYPDEVSFTNFTMTEIGTGIYQFQVDVTHNILLVPQQSLWLLAINTTTELSELVQNVNTHPSNLTYSILLGTINSGASAITVRLEGYTTGTIPTTVIFTDPTTYTVPAL